MQFSKENALCLQAVAHARKSQQKERKWNEMIILPVTYDRKATTSQIIQSLTQILQKRKRKMW